jgi:hypothetical protein
VVGFNECAFCKSCGRLIAIQSRLDALVTNPDLAPLLSLVKGIRNGAVYGAKVRFPHALVYVLSIAGSPISPMLTWPSLL